jgi:hypothetical protein
VIDIPLRHTFVKSAEIRSKHGIIVSCALNVSKMGLETGVFETLAQLSQSYEGTRYGFPEDNPCNPDEIGPRQDLASWLRTAMMT